MITPIRALVLALPLLVAGQTASATTYQMRLFSKDVKAQPVVPPPVVPASCVPGKVAFATAGDFTWSAPDVCTAATIKTWGAGGIGGVASGGAGGFAQADTALDSTPLTIRVGAAGTFDTTTYVNGGGGYTSVSRVNVPYLVAGGGGGAGQTARGGGGGQTGEAIFAGSMGTSTGGGVGCNGGAGTAWTAGIVATPLNGVRSGNGGGGLYGGGAGCVIWWNSQNYGSSGGGGSSYARADLQNVVITGGSYQTPGNSADSDRGGNALPATAGKVVISYR